jgi:GNAT superfamily N-acetyltransferase
MPRRPNRHHQAAAAGRQRPRGVTIRRARRPEAGIFLALVDALADFERLKRPTRAARARLVRDGFGPVRRFDPLLVFFRGDPVGYAILFETYSSFLAKPTLYLEDIFVLPACRGKGIGLALFRRCVAEARRRRCGRMEWCVLDWNRNAIRFYNRAGARRMKNWILYRLVL